MNLLRQALWRLTYEKCQRKWQTNPIWRLLTQLSELLVIGKWLKRTQSEIRLKAEAENHSVWWLLMKMMMTLMMLTRKEVGWYGGSGVVFFCKRVQSESEGIVVTAVSNIKRGRREGGSQSLTRGQKVKSRREREIFEERKRNFKCCFSILRREREIES